MAEKKSSQAKTAAPASDKKQAIQTAMSQIEKMYGKGSIMRLGDQMNAMNIEAISTGSLALDLALGIGGVPRGRIVEIYGPESSGKTTLALHILAQAQKQGGEVAFVDAEHALDPGYARALGVNIDDMLVSQPDTGEQALEITEALVRSGAIDVRRVETLKSGGEVIGNRTRAKVVKNKMAPPFREAEFDIMYGEGISLLGELLDLGVKLDLVQKSGSWFAMGETRLGQGRDAAKQYLKDNPEVADSLEAAIRRDFFKLMGSQSQIAAKAAGRAVDVSADDFDDED